MKKTMKVLAVLLLAVMMVSTTVNASESSSYTYTQSVDKEWIRTQDAYMPGSIFLNDGTFTSPEDLFIFEDKIYVSDVKMDESGAVIGGYILIYDTKTREISTLGEEVLKTPMGLFVTEEAI